MPQVLPLVPSVPNYRVATALDGVSYILDVRWNARDAAWYLDISDANGDLIRAGLKVVLGTLIGARGADSRLPDGVLFAGDSTGAGLDAGLDDMGVRVFVYFYSRAEIAAGALG